MPNIKYTYSHLHTEGSRHLLKSRVTFNGLKQAGPGVHVYLNIGKKSSTGLSTPVNRVSVYF